MHHRSEGESEVIRSLIEKANLETMKNKVSEMEEAVRRAEAKELSLGPTRHYPEGALDPSDEGEIKIAVGVDPESGKVIVNFGSPVAWIGLSVQQARQLAESLRQKSYVVK